METIFFTHYLQEWLRVKRNNQVYQVSLHPQKLQSRLSFKMSIATVMYKTLSGLSDKKELQNDQKLTVHLD